MWNATQGLNGWALMNMIMDLRVGNFLIEWLLASQEGLCSMESVSLVLSYGLMLDNVMKYWGIMPIPFKPSPGYSTVGKRGVHHPGYIHEQW